MGIIILLGWLLCAVLLYAVISRTICFIDDKTNQK